MRLSRSLFLFLRNFLENASPKIFGVELFFLLVMSGIQAVCQLPITTGSAKALRRKKWMMNE